MMWACHNGFSNWHCVASSTSIRAFCGADIDQDDGDIIAAMPTQNTGKRCKRCQEIRQRMFEIKHGVFRGNQKMTPNGSIIDI